MICDILFFVIFGSIAIVGCIIEHRARKIYRTTAQTIDISEIKQSLIYILMFKIIATMVSFLLIKDRNRRQIAIARLWERFWEWPAEHHEEEEEETDWIAILAMNEQYSNFSGSSEKLSFVILLGRSCCNVANRIIWTMQSFYVID